MVLMVALFSIFTLTVFAATDDPSQRANGFLTLVGGVIITFAKEILALITGS